MAYHHLNNLSSQVFCFNGNILNSLSETLIRQKRKSPLVGVEPNASHLPDECPRPLDHRGFPISLTSLIQVIHAMVP